MPEVSGTLRVLRLLGGKLLSMWKAPMQATGALAQEHIMSACRRHPLQVSRCITCAYTGTC